MRKGLKKYDDRGFIHRDKTRKNSEESLIKKWKKDFEANPDSQKFVFAFTNRDVKKFNVKIRKFLQEKGIISKENFEVLTHNGKMSFAKGDKIIFTQTNKKIGILNGTEGEINNIQHDYAGTIYKGQGRTIDQSYLYHTDHWGQSSTYVALTRHRRR